MQIDYHGQTIVVQEIGEIDISKSDQAIITDLLTALKNDGYTDIEAILEKAFDITSLPDDTPERQAGAAIAKSLPLVAYYAAQTPQTARKALEYLPDDMHSILLSKTANRTPVQTAKTEMLKAAKAGDMASTAYAGLVSNDPDVQKAMDTEDMRTVQELVLFKSRYPHLVQNMSDAQILEKYFDMQ